MVDSARYQLSPKVDELGESEVYEMIDWLKSRIPEGESDLVVSIGGDGEVLNSFHEFPDCKILGIKIDDGRSLGFYSAVSLSEVNESVVEKIKNEEYNVISLPLLESSVDGKHKDVLNDVSVLRRPNGKAGRFSIQVGDDYLDAKGDGVIMSSPGGSSSYNFSSGGSIVSWDLRAYSVRFFNLAKGLRSVSIIVPGDTDTVVSSRYDAFLEIDGQGRELEPGIPVSVSLSDNYARIVSLEYHGQLDRLKRMVKSNTLD